MKRKKAYIAAAVLFSAAAVTLLLFAWNNSQKTLLTDTGGKQETHGIGQQGQEPYLSITYTTDDPSVKPSGRMIHFYTYGLESSKLEEKAQIPFRFIICKFILYIPPEAIASLYVKNYIINGFVH